MRAFNYWIWVLTASGLLTGMVLRADDFTNRASSVLNYLNTHAPNLTQFGSGPHRIGRTGFWYGQGRLMFGNANPGTNYIATALQDACAENANAGFSLWPGMDTFFRWGGFVSAETVTNYWTTYTSCALYDNGATPNQQFMDATARYLAGEIFPGSAFASGASYGQGDLTGKAFLKSIIERVPRYNFPEHNSHHYLQYTLGPIRSLADLTYDADLKNKAGMAFDWALAEASSSWLNGHWCVSSCRGAMTTQQYNYDITPMAWWLMFGGPTPASLLDCDQHVVYTMPQFTGVLPEVLAAATDRTQSYTRRSTAERQVGRETVYYKQTWMTPRYALWSQVEGEVGFNVDGSFNLLNLNVPTIADGYQAQRWGLAWDDAPGGDSVLTLTTPTTYSGTTGGTSIYEDTLQLEDTMIAVYNIPATGGTGGNNGDTPNQWVTAHFPAGRLAVIDESTNTGRIFLHYTNVLVALGFTTNFPWAGAVNFTLPCSQMGLAVETAPAGEYPQAAAADRLAAFRNDVLTLGGVNAGEITNPLPRFIYTNRHGSTLELTYGQAGITNGARVDYLQWPMIESPTMYQPQLGNLFILGPSRTILYDFQNWARLTNNHPTVLPAAPVVAVKNSVVDVDLALRATDVETPAGNLVFTVDAASNGVASLLPDARTARFTPTSNHTGSASFQFTATDRGIDPRLVLLYDFEPPSTPAGNVIADVSLNGRPATIGKYGSGTADYDPSSPPALGANSTQSLRLTENGTNAARLTRAVTPANLSLTNGSWTFATWFKRAAKTNDDFLFHIGSGDGFGGGGDELQLYAVSGSDTVALKHWTVANLSDVSIVSLPNITLNEWHHVAVTFDHGAEGAGVVRLYLDGALSGAASNVVWQLPQDTPLVFGGHTTTSGTNLNRYFNGSLDDLALFRGALSPVEVARLATVSVGTFGGRTITNTVSLNVTNTGDMPALPKVVSFGITNSLPNIVISGGPGFTYTVQASTNLVQWTELYSNTPSTLSFSWTDAHASNFTWRFYRILHQP